MNYKKIKRTKMIIVPTCTIISFILLMMIIVDLIIMNYYEGGMVKRAAISLDPDREKTSAAMVLDTTSKRKIDFAKNVATTPRIINENDISCYNETSEVNGLMELESCRGRGPKLGKSIFFLETSCFGEDGLKLNARQACAVESAAKMNPNMTIYLLYLSPSKISNSFSLIIRQFMNYNNIKIRRIFIDNYTKNTPLEKWYATGILNTSEWPRSHMSDILRYLTLWKFGGIYLDLDVVIMKSLEDIENFTGAQDDTLVAAGVMGFGMGYLGRKIASACLKDLVENFSGWAWGENGPGVITRVLQKLCGSKDINEMKPENCEGFMVYDPSVFYPIFYPSWMKYFKLNWKNETMDKIGKSKAIHVWNKLSKSEKIQVGSEVPYAKVAERFCPKVYNNCGTIF